MELSGLRKYDLTAKIVKYFDCHMALPLMESISAKGLYNEKDLLSSKLKLLEKTRLADLAKTVYLQLHETEDVPEEMTKRRETIMQQMQKLQEETRDLAALFADSEVVSRLTQDKLHNIQFLKEKHKFKVEQLDSYYKYAKLLFETGDYPNSAVFLYQFRILCTDPEKNLSALWGKLAAEILSSNFETAYEDFLALKQHLDQKQGSLSHLELLQQRTWLIHWALYIFFNYEKGRDQVLDFFLTPAYRQTIQTSCPHILRYLAAAVILNKRKKDSLKDVVVMIQQESYNYSDPLTQFLESLYINFDFEGAQSSLGECSKVMECDFFLEDSIEEFTKNARHFIFETYCKIHQRIDLGSLAQKLEMDQNEAERWIVDLIRNSNLDAKIDSEKNAVTLVHKSQNIYQLVIEKTKPLNFRTGVLSNNIEKKNAQVATKHRNPRGMKKPMPKKEK